MTAASFRASTLFVTEPQAQVRSRNMAIQVVVDDRAVIHVPLHKLEGIAVFGNVMISSVVLQRCTDAGVAVTFLSESGRLLARVDAPVSGNVLLRRAQFRLADDDEGSLAIARSIVAGKLNNMRNVILHISRDAPEGSLARGYLREAAAAIRTRILGVASTKTADELRGQEGLGARAYFSVFDHLVRAAGFQMTARSRRPPRDPLNALLSFAYALLLNDCVSALAVAGLDPAVGFFHRDRPGRPGLALDLMEEFRPVLADRAVLAALNRRQIGLDAFEEREGGGWSLTREGRKEAIAAYHARRSDEAMHPLLRERAPLGQFPYIQARLLARHVRGEFLAYPPAVLR